MSYAANRFSHDELLYVGQSYLQTHPDRLAAIGRLHGMQPAPAKRCRVLELACGDGSNLLPMAYALPESTFLGLDVATTPLAAGQARADALGLTNVRLEARDLLDFPADAGEFDYIIAHGFYSWCPPAVRERLLAVCGAHLAPQGIAFVSFNAYPGYHAKELHRELMLYHLARSQAHTPTEQAREALGVLEFMARVQPENNLYGTMLTQACEQYHKEIAEKGAAGLAWFHHDLLSTYNTPVYFHEFVAHAERNGLQFMSDAVLRVPRAMTFAPEISAALRAMQGDILAQEQYLDFILCVPYRQVLLCRHEVTLDHTLGAEAMQDLYVAGNLWSENPESPEPTVGSDAAESFVCPHGKVAVKHPDAKQTLRQIGAAWPRAVSFAELEKYQSPEGTGAKLAEFLLRLGVGCFAMFRTLEFASALEVSERPLASAYARLQAEKSALVTNLYHEAVTLEVSSRHLFRLLDGTRDRSKLLEEMRVWIVSGQAAGDYQRAAEAVNASAEAKEAVAPSLEKLEAGLESTLQDLVKLGLIVS